MLLRLITLAAYTVLPLVGVLLLGWDWREIMLLYWLENISLGVAVVIRMLRCANAPGGDDPEPIVEHIVERRVKGRRPRGDGAARSLAGFFALHYGIFTAVYGVFVVLLVAGVFEPIPQTQTPFNWASALIVWVIGGTAQVLAARYGPLPERRGPRLMLGAYQRAIVLNVSIVVGTSLITSVDWPAVVAVFLIGLHALVDGVGWMITAARDRAQLAVLAAREAAREG